MSGDCGGVGMVSLDLDSGRKKVQSVWLLSVF